LEEVVEVIDDRRRKRLLTQEQTTEQPTEPPKPLFGGIIFQIIMMVRELIRSRLEYWRQFLMQSRYPVEYERRKRTVITSIRRVDEGWDIFEREYYE
jgi:hypothetical protein